jgi:HlyD family secretion protein
MRSFGHRSLTARAAGTGITAGAAPLRLALVVAAMAAEVTGCSPAKPKSATTDQPLTATFAPIEMRTMDSGLSASGLLVPREEAAVTTQLDGYRVAEVLVDQGAEVKAGQPLVRLDDTLLKAQLEQAEAAVATQEANVERASAEARRVDGLDNMGVLSQEQIEERRLAARTAKAQLASARAQLADLRVRQGLMVVRAPVSGRVLDRSVRPGDIASRAAVMFRVARDGVVELNAEVPETALTGIHAGEHAEVILAGGATVTGEVRLLSPQVDAQSRLGHVRLTLPVRPDVRPGGFARAEFNTRGAATPAIPERAVNFDADGSSIMVLGGDQRVHRQKVQTGTRSGGFVQLVSGPPVGSQVVLGGAAFLLDGDKVRVGGAAGK